MVKSKNLCRCGNKLYLRNGLPISKLCPTCRKAKAVVKKEKHKLTKAYAKGEKERLQKKADKLYQELGRLTYTECLICGGTYSCLHHFILKSQSFALRYHIENGIPICNKCHCSIHQGQNSEIVGQIIAIKGLYWFKRLSSLKHQTVVNELEHTKNSIELLSERLKNAPGWPRRH